MAKSPRTIIFPSRNNITYRSGFIKLTAFGSEFDQATIEGQTERVVEDLKETQRVLTPDFNGEGLKYLRNAVENMKKERSMMSGEVKFIGILPLPLAIADTTAIEWNSSPSNFIEGAYGKIKKAGIGESSTYAAATTIGNKIGGYFGNDMAGTNGLKHLQNGVGPIGGGFGSGNNQLVEQLINGSSELAKTVANSPAANAYLHPGEGTKKILGMNSDASLMDFHNEAAALNGTRQVIFDPGYWQSFQGVQPREFSLTWDIIPENHEDAINGLELCSRLREFSLPQSVSGVELLSPCYWRIDWSNEYLDSQTLYSNLIIRNIQLDFAQNGEWHGASTPKMFRITISFQEAKAPTSDIYKDGHNFIPVGKAVRGTSRGGGSRGGGGNSGSNGNVNTGTIPGNSPFPNIPGMPPLPTPGDPGGSRDGTVWDIIRGGGILDKIRDQLGNILGPIIDGMVNSVGGNLGEKLEDILKNIGLESLGDLVGDTIDDVSNEAAKILKEAIKTGDFKGIGDKLKGAVLKVNGLSEELGEAIGGDIGNKVADLLGIDVPKDKLGEILQSISKGEITDDAMRVIEEKIKEMVGDKFYGILDGKKLPDIVEVINRPSILLGN